jgi:hypothetical protein
MTSSNSSNERLDFLREGPGWSQICRLKPLLLMALPELISRHDYAGWIDNDMFLSGATFGAALLRVVERKEAAGDPLDAWALLAEKRMASWASPELAHELRTFPGAMERAGNFSFALL